MQIKLYSIIYELIDQVKESMAGMLDPELRETVIATRRSSRCSTCPRARWRAAVVTDGRIARTARARVLRRRQAVYDGGWRRCGVSRTRSRKCAPGWNAVSSSATTADYKVEDIIECYTLEKIAQKL